MKRTDIPVRASGVVSQIIDDAAVLVSPDTALVRVLNPVGSRVWELLDGRRTAADLLAILSAEYQVAPAQLETDLTVFCADLAGRGLLHITAGTGE
jgi:hypothetical protein